MIGRRGVLGGLLAGAAGPVLGDLAWAESGLRPMPRPAALGGTWPEATDLIAAAGLGGASSVMVADARTGAVLEAVGETLSLPPASTVKTFTTLYALEHLGAAHRFHTRILGTGPVQAGQVQGNIVLAGSGDPVLDTDDLGDLAASLAARGIRGCTGRFLVWDQALPDIRQITADQPDHVGYNPAISGINLNFNRVYFEWKRQGQGWALSVDARGERFAPPVTMTTVELTDQASAPFRYRGGRQVEHWTVARSALGRDGSRWLPVRHPGLYAGDVFRAVAAAQGVVLPAPALAASLPAGAVLAECASEPLSDLLRGMLRHSTNLTAEVTGLASSRASGLAASAAAMGDWSRARLGSAGQFVDHSGLGAASRISAAAFVKALTAAQSTPMGPQFKAVLRDLGAPEAGEAGIGGPIQVIGKTGTLNFCSALVGYIQPPSGRELVFAILSADVKRRDALRLSERERPPGGRTWLGKARRLQRELIAGWVRLYG